MSTDSPNQRAAPRALVMAAFAAVYLIWGSTYLGIRFAIETIPPFLMGGVRFVLAGALLYAWLRLLHRVPPPALLHWKHAAVAGTLMLGIGNGGVNWAEQRVSSGVTALIIAVAPLWFALLDWARPGGMRPHGQTLGGIAVGFVGVILLVGSRGSLRSSSIDLAGTLVLLIASLAWAAGSLYSRYKPKPESLLMAAAMQMLIGGVSMLLAAFVFGEQKHFSLANVSPHSVWAFSYLTLVGSLVGFTAYNWLLKTSTPARVSTYAYVNPVIAVFLGWAIGGESLTARMLWAAAVIVLGVVIMTTRRTNGLQPRQQTSTTASRWTTAESASRDAAP